MCFLRYKALIPLKQLKFAQKSVGQDALNNISCWIIIWKYKQLSDLTYTEQCGTPLITQPQLQVFYLFSNSVESLAGKRVVLFSYGSGLAATMFSLRISQDVGPGSSLTQLVTSLRDLKQRLDSRLKVSPSAFADAMKLREDTHHKGKCLCFIKYWPSSLYFNI